MTTSNLQKIKELAASVKSSLTALTVKPDTLEDIDSIANKRILLREQLAVLSDAEAVEAAKIEAEAEAVEAAKRKACLQNIAASAEKLSKQYQDQTDRAVELIDQLVEVLVKREGLFNVESVKLSDQATLESLTHKECGLLIDELDRSIVEINAGQFSEVWKNSVIKHCGDNNKLAWKLRDLVNPANSLYRGTSLPNARSLLADAATHMIENAPENVAEEAELPKIEPTGSRFEADLRDNSKVVNLNNQ